MFFDYLVWCHWKPKQLSQVSGPTYWTLFIIGIINTPRWILCPNYENSWIFQRPKTTNIVQSIATAADTNSLKWQPRPRFSFSTNSQVSTGFEYNCCCWTSANPRLQTRKRSYNYCAFNLRCWKTSLTKKVFIYMPTVRPTHTRASS